MLSISSLVCKWCPSILRLLSANFKNLQITLYKLLLIVVVVVVVVVLLVVVVPLYCDTNTNTNTITTATTYNNDIIY